MAKMNLMLLSDDDVAVLRQVLGTFRTLRIPGGSIGPNGIAFPQPKPNATTVGDGRLWVEVTGEDEEDQGNFSFKYLQVVNGALQDTDPLLESDGFTLQQPSGETGLAVGDRGLAFCVGHDADGKARFQFVAGGGLPEPTALYQVYQPISGEPGAWTKAWDGPRIMEGE
jgi:hypothetical protein